ncbi:2,5-dichloro-2,5-cyclohexadiene-1,4-diol dehydrogenase [Frankia canadensis]|uniref:2,5-dichloro-2,5-cyclohexadiene-1,4-diol dehydrogenase n=2 Tax=Frankia canadensis TaxID=1836972 RepID=A0A2I2KHW5_9ACTN|nr:2,5-dichloro-2,5-cyclohexadiene-1,4-diol dehydrogenase [Frankia canadensis]SOU52546.1 2,5-dichloro-2,5-cyclohexadiene-1,4-diol dehydrogenase [Frankia canadensis]
MSGLVAGKVALVTGAASGIGRASAMAFAREGAMVTVADVDADGGAETVRLVEAAGGEAIFVRCDIADEDDVRSAVAVTVERFGRLDCAHNNAGLGHGQAKLAEIDRNRWDRTVAVNLTGTWLCLKYEIQHMLERGEGGAIVVTSSATSLLAFPLTAGYAATKAGINQLVRSAAKEYGRDGIRVNAVLPGPISTEMVARSFVENPSLQKHLEEDVPLGRLGTPEEVADTVVFLCSGNAGFISGSMLTIDGGQTPW